MTDTFRQTQAAKQHFFASSATDWIVTTDKRSLRDVVKYMDDRKLTWNLWLVPLPHDAEYEIEWFAPKVDGAQFLEEFQFKNGRKV